MRLTPKMERGLRDIADKRDARVPPAVKTALKRRGLIHRARWAELVGADRATTEAMRDWAWDWAPTHTGHRELTRLSEAQRG